MSASQPTPAPAPQPSTVASEPATVQACQADWDDRASVTPIHPSSYEAGPHTSGRRS